MSKLITFEELKKNYLAEIYPKIDSFKDSINDPYLTKLLSIKNVYTLFNNIGANNSFIDKCELYHTLRYNIDDDGDIAFVKCKWKFYNNVMSEYKKEEIWDNRTTYFVMYGHHTELKDEEVLKLATEYHPFKDKPEILISYQACHVRWDILDTIIKYESIIEACAPLYEISDWETNRINYAKARKIEKSAEAEFDNYILSNKYITERIV